MQGMAKIVRFLKPNPHLSTVNGSLGGLVLETKPEMISVLDMIGFSIQLNDETPATYEFTRRITNLFENYTLAQLIEWDQ